ncbi:MAG: flagellin [Parvibaculum sp.]|uniref:flagellin N-terminal helical domain-containing protein n=1 Tax=Parvibaculum sp. TaxID=2024848 RepID=UPI0032EFFC38
MGDITISSAVRTNLLTLQNTAQMMAQTQNRLATGLKVSSALDNPQSYFTAAGLSSRATDMSALLDSMSLGVQTLKAADEGIKSIQKLVDQAKSVANQALQSKATETSVTETVEAAAIAGTAGARTVTFQIGTASAVSVVFGTATYASAASSATAIESELAGLVSAGGTLAGLTVSRSGGDLTFTVASGEDLTIAGTAAATGAAGFGIAGATTNGETLAEARTAFSTDYNNLLAQIDQLSLDTSFNGINLLAGDDLSVMFNESSTSKLDIEGVTFNAAGIGLTETTFSDINAEVTKLNTATSTLRKQSSTFGANLSVVQSRQDFTKNMIDVLEAGAGNLTLADTNVEAANLLALQTRQSLASTSLSLANQSEQSVLSLLR